MEFQNFLKLIKHKLLTEEFGAKPLGEIDNFTPLDEQAFYVLNWKSLDLNKVSGFYELLGYQNNELDVKKLTNSLIHPDDLKYVDAIIQESVQFCVENKVDAGGKLILSYRMKRKDGSYVKILRQSGAYEFSSNGVLISNYSLLTDISSYDKTNIVQWDLRANQIDINEVNQRIKKAISPDITPRELDILYLINDGLQSKDIAQKLFISEHTVKSHRKKLFQKLNVKTATELIKKAKESTIL